MLRIRNSPSNPDLRIGSTCVRVIAVVRAVSHYKTELSHQNQDLWPVRLFKIFRLHLKYGMWLDIPVPIWHCVVRAYI